MNIHKICNHCNKHIVCTDVDMLLQSSTHSDMCKYVYKLTHNQWWKFWINESYSYIK